MADIPGIPTLNTDALAAKANAAGYTFATTSFYLLIVCGVVALIIILLYKKSFNIRVTVYDTTKGGLLVRDNFRGKLFQIRPGEFRFKIYNAKKYKLRYNEESFSNDDLYYDVSENGKTTRRLFMTFDSEGQLNPLTIKMEKFTEPKIDSKGLPVIDEKGNVVTEEKTVAKAIVKQADISYFFKELDKSGEVFDTRGFFDKNGWLILVICLVLTLGVFLYTAYKFSGAADKMGDVVAAQGQLIHALALQSNSTVIRSGVPL